MNSRKQILSRKRTNPIIMQLQTHETDYRYGSKQHSEQ